VCTIFLFAQATQFMYYTLYIFLVYIFHSESKSFTNMLATILLDGTVVLVNSIKDAITTAEDVRNA